MPEPQFVTADVKYYGALLESVAPPQPAKLFDSARPGICRWRMHGGHEVTVDVNLVGKVAGLLLVEQEDAAWEGAWAAYVPVEAVRVPPR